jgi:hypothetical protein
MGPTSYKTTPAKRRKESEMFRTVTLDLRLVRSVVTGLKKFAGIMAQSFGRRAAMHLRPGEELPEGFLTLLQVIVARMIENAGARLSKAEAAHRKSLRIEEQIRARRDQITTVLYQKLLKLRKTFEAFGKGMSVRFLGLDPGFGKADPQVLLRYGQEAVDVLSDAEFQPPETATLTVDTLSPEEHAAEVLPTLEALESVLDELEDQKRSTEEALKEKTQGGDAFRETFVYGSRFNEALYVLAGEKFHSVRLRPKVGVVGSSEVLTLDGEVVVQLEGDSSEPGSEESGSEESGSEESGDEESAPPASSPTEEEASPG